MLDKTGHTLHRQWIMLRALPRWPQSVTVKTLMEQVSDAHHATTRRTIERDLQDMSEHLPLFVDTSRRPYRWSWAKDADFEFSPRLTAQESLALKLVEKHAAAMLPRPMLDDLAPVFDDAERQLAHTGWKDWADSIAVLPPHLVLLPPQLDPEVTANVHDALFRQRVLVALYLAKGAPAAECMRMHPLGMVLRDPVQYLVCTVEGRKGIRTLVLHRMSATSVDVVPCAKKPKDFSIADFAANLSIAPKGRVRLRLRFHEFAGDHVRETRLSEDQKCTVISKGVVEISAIREWDDELEWWLMKFGSRLEVLKPVALRRVIAEEHAKAAARYAPAPVRSR